MSKSARFAARKASRKTQRSALEQKQKLLDRRDFNNPRRIVNGEPSLDRVLTMLARFYGSDNA